MVLLAGAAGVLAGRMIVMRRAPTMDASPLNVETAFMLGPLAVTWPVVTTWGVMAVLTVGSFLDDTPTVAKPGPVQAVLELVVSTLDHEIARRWRAIPARFRALIGTLLIFVLCGQLVIAGPRGRAAQPRISKPMPRWPRLFVAYLLGHPGARASVAGLPASPTPG
jgi:hypothetical protein